MIETLRFSKYSGAGNSFLLVDNRKGIFPTEDPLLVPRLCDPKGGIGADGVILLEPNPSADATMRILNADGSPAEMCGNGARCFYRFLNELEGERESYLVETSFGQKICLSRDGEAVRVDMPSPTKIHWNQLLKIDQREIKLHYLEVGVPHVIWEEPSMSEEAWLTIAPQILRHPLFSPQGVNVNWLRSNRDNCLSLRTYERGVGETLACGTGAVAAALCLAFLRNISAPIEVMPLSQEAIRVYFKQQQSGVFSEVAMSGPAHKITTGEWKLW